MLSPEEKLDEALKETFPASDAFYLPPDDAASRNALEEKSAKQCSVPACRTEGAQTSIRPGKRIRAKFRNVGRRVIERIKVELLRRSS